METETLSLADAERLCLQALDAVGASKQMARALTASFLEAEAAGQANVGLAHLMDHLKAIEAGRIDAAASPIISLTAPAFILSDAQGGIAQLGFDLALDDLVARASSLGIALFAQRNAYTCGSLGVFADRLARRGLVAFAAASGPALMAGSGGTKPVYCTNPLAFAAPCGDGPRRS